MLYFIIMKIKAVSLFSGGLDSTLATKIVQENNIDVLALNFYTGFCTIEFKRILGKEKNVENPVVKMADMINVPLEIINITEEYLEMLTKPKFGYGKAVNPCIDCRIMMLKKASEYIKNGKASFVITGEVLNQRPMSQFLNTLNLIEKESGLKGLILRPLSAQLLPPTIPEINGWIKRENLYAIKGRTRKIQIELAKKFGIKDYFQPSGICCFLTDKNYAKRFFDFVKHNEKITTDDIMLMKIGRHFRINNKLIVGRFEEENKFLEKYKKDKIFIYPEKHKGPSAIMYENPSEEEIEIACSILARYCDKEDDKEIPIIVKVKDNLEKIIKSIPMDENLIKIYSIK